MKVVQFAAGLAIGITVIVSLGSADGDSRLHRQLREIERTRLPPVGTVIAFAGSEAPEGWLLCDETRHNVRDYEELVEVLPAEIAAVSNGKFSVPHLAGRFVLGEGTGRGLSARQLGDLGGEETHRLHVREIPRHNHAQHVTANPGHGRVKGRRDYVSDRENMAMYEHGVSTADAGGGKPHNNMPPYLTLRFLVKF